MDVLLSPLGQKPPCSCGDEDEHEDAIALNEDDYGITNILDEIKLYDEGEVKDPLLSNSQRREKKDR